MLSKSALLVAVLVINLPSPLQAHDIYSHLVEHRRSGARRRRRGGAHRAGRPVVTRPSLRASCDDRPSSTMAWTTFIVITLARRSGRARRSPSSRSTPGTRPRPPRPRPVGRRDRGRDDGLDHVVGIVVAVVGAHDDPPPRRAVPIAPSGGRGDRARRGDADHLVGGLTGDLRPRADDVEGERRDSGSRFHRPGPTRHQRQAVSSGASRYHSWSVNGLCWGPCRAQRRRPRCRSSRRPRTSSPPSSAGPAGRRRRLQRTVEYSVTATVGSVRPRRRGR